MPELKQFGLKSLLRIACSVALMLFALSDAAEYGFAPVSGQMTSAFGWRVDPFTGAKRFHGGIDLAASAGTAVYAPQAGQVAYSGNYGGYGNVVVLHHGNSLYTLYGHNSQLLVKAGDAVYRGQVISKVGSSGRSTGPHLHFEVHHNGQYVNPLTYLAYLQPEAGGPRLAQAKTAATSLSANGTPRGSAAGTVKPVAQRTTSGQKQGRAQVELLTGSDVETIRF